MKLEEFVGKLKEVYGENLVSVTLYGSAVTQDFSKTSSDYNIIIVLNEITPFELEKGANIIRKWIKAGNSMPLFFDTKHIETSVDVFPIEFYDIRQNRKILFGKDPFENIEIENTNLRHQCESELKGKILQLQSGFVQVSNKEKEVGKLMVRTLSPFFATFKGIIRLSGAEPKPRKREQIEQLAKVADINPNIFLELLDIKDGTSILPRTGLTEKFEDYLTQLKLIANFVDQFNTKTSCKD